MFEVLRKMLTIRESLSNFRIFADHEMVDLDDQVPELKQMEKLAAEAYKSIEAYYAD